MTSIFRSLRTLLVVVAALATASCGFHLRGSYNLPDEIQKLSITSFDKYGALTREMKTQLRLHDIDIIEPAERISNLRLNGESYGESTLSLYQNSRVAEKQFAYSVSYTVTVPGKGNYNFSTSLSRTYLDNPLTALAKSVEEEMLAQEMRVEATKQIMRQLARLNAHIEEFERKEAEEKALRELYQGFSEETPSVSIETRFDGKDEPQGKPLSSYSTTPSDDTTEARVEGDTTP
ncbi:LPS-assembly lipoprotein LptE [Enterovibrio norvegicus]|uniref:LPS-assembly lipoprotein LptE n=1 Tax=Enterovibrio norvegicus TaxID=188144 RepID=A0ABV4L7B9_9GAMM|nr:LPS assembly lipoprotein LptE [Enterovibrio norvegicus]OEE44399.1 LPS biosynthesis protein [Enterovibrio norvegicus]OEF55031.1 LPS biosynthesis protein [Enterovibrio norvegicus]